MTQNPHPGNGPDASIGGPTAVVAIDRIQQNPYQPRKAFDDDELAGLSPASRPTASCSRSSFAPSATNSN